MTGSLLLPIDPDDPHLACPADAYARLIATSRTTTRTHVGSARKTSDDDGTSLGGLRAYEAIRNAIVENRYLPGERLIEQRVAEEFGLSRTPVREAIRRLEAEGLVVTMPNRGAIIREVTVEEVIDLYEMRGRLEGYAASLAAQRRTPEHLDVLRDAVGRFGAAISTFDHDRIESVRDIGAHNQAVHSTILEAAAHRRLTWILHRTVDVPLVYQAFQSFSTDDIRRSNLFHHLIFEAIEAQNAERAGMLMCEHIYQARDTLMKRLEPPGERSVTVRK